MTGALRLIISCCLAWSLVATSMAQDSGQVASPIQLLKNSKTTVFLGDSITAAGQYIGFIEAWMLTQNWSHYPHIIDAGLASETLSGLSEEGHAGGKFPRPDLAERLDRVLALTKPDLVFACYGINCGIYQPFDTNRFLAYQAGYHHLKKKVEAAGAQLVVITPPFYDDQRKPVGAFSYNSVLDRYAEWLSTQSTSGWQVIDLHSAMTAEILQQRQSIADFSLQPDGVHPDSAGHWCMARHIIAGLGGNISRDTTPEQMLLAAGYDPAALALLQKRVELLRSSYVGAAGHKRPGVAQGLPIGDVESKAAELLKQIQALKSPPPNS